MFDFNKILNESTENVSVTKNTIGSKIALDTINKASEITRCMNEDFSSVASKLNEVRQNISKDIMRSNVLATMYSESSTVSQPFTVDAYNYTFDRNNKYPTFKPLINLLESTCADIEEKDRQMYSVSNEKRRAKLYNILKESAKELINMANTATSVVTGIREADEDNFIYRSYSYYRGGKETLPYTLTITPNMIQNIPDFAEVMTESIELYDKGFHRVMRDTNKLIGLVENVAPDYVVILKEAVTDYMNCANIAYAIKADAVAEYIGTYFNESGYSRETNPDLAFFKTGNRSTAYEFYDGIFNESMDFDFDDVNVLYSMEDVSYIPFMEDMKGAYINYIGTRLSESAIALHEADEGGFFLVRWWNKLVDWVSGLFEKDAEEKVGPRSRAVEEVNWMAQNAELILKIAAENPNGELNLYDMAGEDTDKNVTQQRLTEKNLQAAKDARQQRMQKRAQDQNLANYAADLEKEANGG